MKSVMLTGATGFIGSHIARHLVHNQIETRLYVRSRNHVTQWLEKNGAELYVGKPDDQATLRASLENADVIIHCAGATKALSEKDYFQANVAFTTRILNLIHHPQQLIFISSQAVAGPSDSQFPLDETRKPNPLTYYGKSKHLAESHVRQWGKDNHNSFTILRPCVVYGPGEKDIYNYFKLMKRGIFLLLGDGKKRFSIVHVEDLVGAILSCLDTPAVGETYFVCSDESPSWEELGDVIQKALNKNHVVKIKVPEHMAFAAACLLDALSYVTRSAPLVNRQKIIEAKQPAWVCSNRKIKEKMHWRPQVSLHQGITQTAQWYIQEKWI